MFQIEWHEYIHKMKRQIGGKMWSLTQTVAVFINDEFLGSDVEFLRYISQNYIFSLPVGVEFYENLATERCKQFIEKSKRKYVYFTFSLNNSTIGSFVFVLYSDLLPLTCQYFLNLCTGYDEVKECYKDAYYINTHLHRIVKNGWIQCGGFESHLINENTANVEIPDESYCIPHDRRGVLSIVNNGKHCNKSQFIICLKPNPWMNYFYVAFGQLVDGARTLKILENISTYYEHPIKQVIISRCGEYIFGDEIKMETESKIFFEHSSPISMEGENVRVSDSAFNFCSITPWLDNIVDKVDVRDTKSLLIAEQYLNGLYCLSSDYEPGMDMRVYEKIYLIGMAKYDTTTTKLHDLLLNFRPDTMTEREKIIFVSEISKIILAYIFHHEHNEFCLQHISLNTHAVIHKVLKIAHEISLKAIEKAETKSLIFQKCRYSKIRKMFEVNHVNNILVSEDCMSLLEEILNKAIVCLMRTFEIQE
ncbi:PREDICTED: peptidyl-prolyl cis-trans isomerase-like 6 [Eufriesea mexicana]|uniref:peptidyl-prolyl cis-trans isomerase-like 6 n=1 Tax=Eufriesea mexicana TaxID=516756 RepID=UPI00083C36BF|nr:PREDICTED: peptidyl-prolyl cis-trans isomerase-like 6 [Eufriesea mexicana]